MKIREMKQNTQTVTRAFENSRMTKRFVACAIAILITFGLTNIGNAAILYSEDFEDTPATNPGGPNVDPGQASSAFGWSGFNHFGTDYAPFSNPAQILNDQTLGGDWRSFYGNQSGTSTIWMETAVTAFDQANFLNDLQVSFSHLEDSTTQRYRIAFKVGGNWYLQDNSSVAGSTGTPATSSITVAGTDFAAFTAPTGAFTPPALDLPGSAALPAGTIDGFGFLMGNKTVTAHAFRWDDVQITATPTPEPSSIALVGLAGLALISLSRRGQLRGVRT